MFPLDSETGKAWSSDSVKMLTDKFSSEADAELRARDEERSDGVLCAKNGYKAYVADSNGRFVIDAGLSKLRHTGRERRLLRNRKMAEFCLTATSEAEFIRTHVLGDKRMQGLRRWLDEPESDPKEPVALPRISESVSEPEPLKRRPGRPRKASFAVT